MRFRKRNFNIKKYRKGQFLILTFSFLILAMLSIYFLETTNIFIDDKGTNHIIEDIVYETCYIGFNNNGTELDKKLHQFSNNITDYCISNNWNCTLKIETNTTIPPNGNWSLLNYSYYNFLFKYNISEINGNYSFKCIK